MADTICGIPVLRAFPSTGTAAKLSIYNNRPAIKFDTVNQEILLQDILTDKYLGGFLRIKWYWTMSPHSASNVIWELSYRALKAGVDYTTATFNITKTVVAASAGNNLLNITTLDFTNTELTYDANALNELFRLKFKVTTLPSTIYLVDVIFENI